MRIQVAHPVPVRWRPSAAGRERMAFLLTTTTVEIEEAPRKDILSTPYAIESPHGRTQGYVYGDRLWRRLSRDDLDRSRSEQAATPRELANALGSVSDLSGLALLPGTPLLTNDRSSARPHARGSELPDGVLSRAVSDLTEPVRAALRTHLRDGFITDGTHVYAAQRLPVISPHNGPTRILNAPSYEIGERGLGIAFEPGRFPFLTAYLRRSGIRGDMYDEDVAGILEQTRGLPDLGEDLRIFSNDGPILATMLVRYSAGERWGRNLDLTAAARHAARLAPFADLALVGAVDPRDRAEVAETVGLTLDALRSAIPPKRHPRPLNWLRTYVATVARPYHGEHVVPIPEEDVEDLGSLAP